MRAPALAALVPLALLATACSGDDDGGWSAYGGGDGLQSIGTSLAALPDLGADQDVIGWGDLARAAEIAGVERPSDPGDGEAVRQYVNAVTGVPSEGDASALAAAVPPEAAQADRPEQAAFAEELGWSILDVDRFVEGHTTPGVVTVLEGSFDEGRLNDALGEPDDGTWTVGGGEPYAVNPQETSPARPLGESLWLTQAGDDLTVARSADDSAAVEQALAGDTDATLASDPALAGLAAALDAESPYAAMLMRPAPSSGGVPSGRLTPEQAEALCEEDGALPEPAAAVGTAIADDDGPVILVALAHTSPDGAEANAESLERMAEEGASFATGQAWSDVVRLDGVEVGGDGVVALTRLRPVEARNVGLWRQLIVQQDSLVASGPC